MTYDAEVAAPRPATVQSVAVPRVAAALEPTGEPRVDDALARLQDVVGAPLEEQLPIYQDVHRRLHETLADLDPR